MPALNFSRLSKIPPMPNTTNCGHPAAVDVSYTCHSAVLHWAYVDLGLTQHQANLQVTALTKAACPGCNRAGMPHCSLPAYRYGELFCHTAQRIYKNQLQTLQAGDVLITGAPTLPNHSMVVRQVRRGPNHNHVTVRGFNNFGTLNTGILMQYDASSHNITQDKYWVSNAMFGVSPFGIELYRITYANYSHQVLINRNILL